MGCTVEASFHARGGLVVREQRTWAQGRLAMESIVVLDAAS
jgi:hypothetical protein